MKTILNYLFISWWCYYGCILQAGGHKVKVLSVFTCFMFLLFQSGKVKNLNMNVKKKWKTVWKCKKSLDYLRFHNGSEKLIKSSLKTHENDTITRIFSRKFENISSNWFHNFILIFWPGLIEFFWPAVGFWSA